MQMGILISLTAFVSISSFIYLREKNMMQLKSSDSPSCLHFYFVSVQVIHNEALVVLALLT